MYTQNLAVLFMFKLCVIKNRNLLSFNTLEFVRKFLIIVTILGNILKLLINLSSTTWKAYLECTQYLITNSSWNLITSPHLFNSNFHSIYEQRRFCRNITSEIHQSSENLLLRKISHTNSFIKVEGISLTRPTTTAAELNSDNKLPHSSFGTDQSFSYLLMPRYKSASSTEV